MTKISVIIPYHNVEKYIEQSITSVINQTLNDIEIICINDFSTDSSEEIVRKYAQNDSRIKMLSTNKLSGQAHARNMGLDIAEGEYIGFVDSDDWVEAGMFEKMYNKAKLHDTDITMCLAKLYDDKTKEYSQNDYYDLKNLEKFKENSFNCYDTKDEILNINVVIWNKIYKNEFLKTAGEKFPDGFIYEDLPFFFGTYLKAKRVNIVWDWLYYYRQNRIYSTMQNIDKKVYDRIPMVSLTYNKLKEAPFYKEKETEILSWIIDDIFHRFTLLDEKYYKEYFYNMKKFFSGFDLTEDEKSKLDVCYAYEEFLNILKNNYFDFGKFLIEKYKTTNKKIKTILHERNIIIKEINDKWQQYYDKEKESWQEYIDNEKKEHENYVKSLNIQMIEQELALKKWQSKSLREQEEKLNADFKWKLQNQKYMYLIALKKQKDYYENSFLSVKINLKIKKFIGQAKNKIKNIFKKN